MVCVSDLKPAALAAGVPFAALTALEAQAMGACWKYVDEYIAGAETYRRDRVSLAGYINSRLRSDADGGEVLAASPLQRNPHLAAAVEKQMAIVQAQFPLLGNTGLYWEGPACA